jgi:hypothetical protein
LPANQRQNLLSPIHANSLMQTNEKKVNFSNLNATSKYLTRGVISADSKGQLLKLKATNMLASALSPIAG